MGVLRFSSLGGVGGPGGVGGGVGGIGTLLVEGLTVGFGPGGFGLSPVLGVSG